MTRNELIRVLQAMDNHYPAADAEVVVFSWDEVGIGHAVDTVELDPAGVVVIRTQWRP